MARVVRVRERKEEGLLEEGEGGKRRELSICKVKEEAARSEGM